MIENKTKSQVLTASLAVGTSGKAGYLHSVTCAHAGAAALSLAQVYDGIDATGTEKWRIGTPNTASASKSIHGLKIHCPSGIYVAVSNAVVTIEYSGCA